jgi:CxxC motif-containing protein
MGKFVNVPLPISDATAAMPTPVDSGTTDGATSGKLTDSTQTFITAGVAVGDVIIGATVAVGVTAVVTAVDSETVLSIGGDAAAVASLEASGEAFKIFTNADAHTLVNSAATFTADVNVGDVVINNTSGGVAKVTKVLSDTAVLIDNIIFNDNSTDDGVIISQSGKGCLLVNAENIATIEPTAGGAGTTPVVIKYKTKTAGNDTLTITINTAQADYGWQLAFEKEMIEVLESDWSDVVREMPLLRSPDGSTVQVMFASGIALA